MAAMFEVEFHSENGGRAAFIAETVIANDALEAIAKATKKVGPKLMRSEGGLFPTNVRVLGWES